MDMNLDEWEFIPDAGLLEIHEDGRHKIFTRSFVKDSSKKFFNNYFEFPSSKSQEFVESTTIPRLPKQIVPLPIEFQPSISKAPDQELVKEVIIQTPNRISVEPDLVDEKFRFPYIYQGAEQDSVTQVFFKKMKENEFVDMKMDSPRSSSRGIVSQIDANKFVFDEKIDHQKMDMEAEAEEEEEEEEEEDDDDKSFNMWKRSLTGIGAICCFGVAAAATICIIIIGGGHRQNQHNHQKLHSQIYADDKRVIHQTSRLSEEVSAAARGIPLARAQITYGGHYSF